MSFTTCSAVNAIDLTLEIVFFYNSKLAGHIRRPRDVFSVARKRVQPRPAVVVKHVVLMGKRRK